MGDELQEFTEETPEVLEIPETPETPEGEEAAEEQSELEKLRAELAEAQAKVNAAEEEKAASQHQQAKASTAEEVLGFAELGEYLEGETLEELKASAEKLSRAMEAAKTLRQATPEGRVELAQNILGEWGFEGWDQVLESGVIERAILSAQTEEVQLSNFAARQLPEFVRKFDKAFMDLGYEFFPGKIRKRTALNGETSTFSPLNPRGQLSVEEAPGRHILS